ncbi:MAG: sensor histidine kinase [Solirubrobacteraceae bacterium]
MARRLARSPVVLDWHPVLVVPIVLVIDAALSAQGKPIGVVNVLCAFVACAPLALRRHVSFPVLAPLIVGGVTLALWQLHPANTVVVIPMVALFELALNGDRRRSLWMSLAIVPCVVISVIPFASGFSHVTSIVIRNIALVLLAIAAGEVIRTRRVSEVRLVQTAEQQTLRRVGEERLRIAREIHDVVAHAMTAINVQAGVAAINVQAGVAAHLLERDPGQAYDALRTIKHTSGAALTDLRSTLEVLRDPAAAAPLGPPAGLGDIAELTGGLRSAGVSVTLDVDSAADVPAPVQSVAYRIVQEALTNVARHAQATAATVSMRRVPGAITVEVTDDGTTTPATPAADPPGNGIRGMLERAAALGGTLEAGPGVHGGWRVQAKLPMSGPAMRGSTALVSTEGKDGELQR